MCCVIISLSQDLCLARLYMLIVAARLEVFDYPTVHHEEHLFYVEFYVDEIPRLLFFGQARALLGTHDVT
jgi:hypothetical protein